MKINIFSKMFSTKKNAIYSIFLAITVLLTFSLVIWTATEKRAGEIVLNDAQLSFTDSVITEYIVGETVDTNGVKMSVGGKEVEFTAEADFSAAGKKAVKLSYTDENGTHVASYAVDVYTVKHFDLRSFPSTMFRLPNGGYLMDEPVIWAALSDNIYSDRFMLTPENPKWYNTVRLTGDVYKITRQEDEKVGILTSTVNFGKYTDISFKSLIVSGGFDQSRVNGSIKVMPLSNQNEESQNRLTLFVKTATPVNSESRKMEATGVYVYEKRTAYGSTYEYYNFSYWMDGGWGSHFESSGVTETLAADTVNYFCTVQGETFTAVGTEWRAAFIVV